MRSSPLVASTLLPFFLLTQVHAQAAREKTFEEIVNAPLVLRKAGTDKVKVTTDLRYTTADDPNLLMDVYAPPGLATGERRPVVLFVHGGAGSASRPKDWGIYQGWGRLAAASGFIGVTFTHRLGFPNPYLENSAADVGAALDYVRKNAATLNADPDRICLAAYSAGGPLLTLGFDEKRPYVRCLVAVYAFLDVQRGDGAGARGRDLDAGLVRHDLDQRLVLLHGVARFHQPAHDLALGHAFADVGQLHVIVRGGVGGHGYSTKSKRPIRCSARCSRSPRSLSAR